jgi:protein TonB
MFEHSLIDLETRQQPARRRWISLPVAVALHLVAFAAFGFGTYWSVGTVPEPPVNIAFIDVMLPPPPPPVKRGGGKPPEPTKSQTPLKPLPPQQPVQPDPARVPDKPPSNTVQDTTEDLSAPGTDPTAPAGPGDPNGDPLGDPNGSKNGKPEGEFPTVEEETGPVHLTAAMTPPVATLKVQPRYTETARRANIQGVVVVEAIVDEQGRVTDARVLRGLPMGLDRAAIEAIQQWKFRPAMMQGRPVKVYFTLTATFTLQR